MVNDRSGGSEQFAIPGGVRSAQSSQFMVNDRSNGSSAFEVNDRSIESDRFNIGEKSIGSLNFNINSLKPS